MVFYNKKKKRNNEKNTIKKQRKKAIANSFRYVWQKCQECEHKKKCTRKGKGRQVAPYF